MGGQILKTKLKQGKTVYGTIFQHSVNPAMIDALPPNALDFVIVTSEHNALDLAEYLPLRHALAAKKITCLARIHSRDPADVSKVCDSYDGVVVPYVEDYEHAKALAAAAVYRPLKGERLDRVLREGKWPNEETRQFVEKSNANTVFVPMIESVPAVENLDKICSVPGVDALFVGPGDLTVNMGIPKQYDHPELIAMIKKIIDIGARHHVAAGSWFGEREHVIRTIRQGARFVVYSSDTAMMTATMESAFREFRTG